MVLNMGGMSHSLTQYLLYQCIYAVALLLPLFVAKLSHFPGVLHIARFCVTDELLTPTTKRETHRPIVGTRLDTLPRNLGKKLVSRLFYHPW